MKILPHVACVTVIALTSLAAVVSAQHLPAPVFDHGGIVASAVAVADLDGDGKPDVVTSNAETDDVSVLLADDACGWRDVSTHPAGNSPSGVAVGDLDGDGFLDIAASIRFDSSVTVLFGGGAGGISATLSLGVGSVPIDVGIADVTGDGALDIVTANVGSDNVSVLVGDGAGRFLASLDLNVDRDPVDLDLGDLNGDGADDIVSMDAEYPGVASVILTDGAGGFQPVSNLTGAPVGWNASFIQIVDFDVDGDGDVVMGNGQGTASWLEGDGAGALLPAVALTNAVRPNLVADVTGDGHPETLAAGNDLRVSLNDGAGGFPAEASRQAIADVGNALAVADMDADGVVDLVVAGNQVVQVLPGDGAGRFEQAITSVVELNAPDLNVHGGVFADLDADGFLDLVAESNYPNGVDVYLSDGMGGYLDPVDHPFGSNMLLVEDMNHDTIPDIVVGNGLLVVTLLGDGMGAFVQQAPFVSGYDADKFDIADVNEDGHLDLVVVDGSFGGDMVLILGDGAGDFGPVTIVQPGIFSVAEVGDLDGDPHPDIVAMTEGELWLLPNDGFTSFPTPTIVPLVDAAFGRRIIVEDLDGDLDQDVVVAHDAGVSVLLGDGAGTFSAPVHYPGAVAWGETVSLVDLDLDGALDLITRPTALNSIAVRQGDGLGGFSAAHIHAAGGPAYVVGVQDETGDGYPDLRIAGNWLEKSVRLLGNLAGPWVVCQGGAAGTHGVPRFRATGPLIGDEDITLTLEDALGGGGAWLVVGLSTAVVPLKGGVLVPAPDQVLGPLPLGPAGSLSITGPVPVGLPPGTELSLQYWLADPLAANGWAASNGVAGITP